MKIAILSLRSRFGDVTGDCVQADKTVEALKELGQNVARYYLDPHTSTVYDKNNESAGSWVETMRDVDIIHTIPPIPWKCIPHRNKLKAKFVSSTVFWRSGVYWKVLLRNQCKVDVNLLKLILSEVSARVGIKLITAKKGYDILLPNSEDEIRCVRKYCWLKPGVKLIAVPNAIDPIPSWVSDLPRMPVVPKEDYVLVPGFFAPRKNQSTLVRALRNFQHPVVFIGKGPLLELCRNEAQEHMLFLGHIEHESRDFYSLLKFARVCCLPSNCETPGIAGLEAAALGARPVVPYEGGTTEYYGWDAEYLDPLSEESVHNAVCRAWSRGQLTIEEQMHYRRLTWQVCAEKTLDAYKSVV